MATYCLVGRTVVTGTVVSHSASAHLVVADSVVAHLMVADLVVVEDAKMEEIVEAFALNSYLESFYRRKCHRFLVDFGHRLGTAHTEDNSYIHFRIADSCNSDSTGTDVLPGQVDHVKAGPLWRNSPKLKYLFFSVANIRKLSSSSSH